MVQPGDERKERERIEALLFEALESGEPTEMTKADWAELKRQVWERHAKQKGKGKGK